MDQVEDPHETTRSPPLAFQIAESHAGSPRKRTEYSHQLHYQAVDPSHPISHS